MMFSKIKHMLGLYETLTKAVFLYLYVCVFVYVYLHIRYSWTLFLRSSYHNLFKNIAHVVPVLNFSQSCICVFVYLYLGNEGVLVGELVVDVISFQKIFGLCGLKCHIVEIWRDVTFGDDGRTHGM